MALAPHIDTATASGMCNVWCDQLDTPAGSMKVFSGALPAECATADPTGVLVTITLPTPAMGAASSGVAAKAGTWSGTATPGSPFSAAFFGCSCD